MGWGRTLEEIWDRSAALAQFCGLINFLKTNEVDYQPQEALHNNNNFIQQHSLEMSRVECCLNRHIENTIRRRITASPLEKKKKKNPLTARSTSRNSIQIPLICETQFRFPFLCEGISYPPICICSEFTFCVLMVPYSDERIVVAHFQSLST